MRLIEVEVALEEDDLGEVFVEGEKLLWEVTEDSETFFILFGRVKAEGLRISRIRKGWTFGKKCGNGLGDGPEEELDRCVVETEDGEEGGQG